jgi:hypothetical protein
MITPLLQSALEPVVRRHRNLRTLLFAIGLTLALALAVWLIPARLPLVVAALLAYFIGWRLAVRFGDQWEPDYTKIARLIESRHPELHALLLTAVEQKPDPKTGRLHYLQQRVLAEAAEIAIRDQWIDSIPTWRLNLGRVAFTVALVALLSSVFFHPRRVTPRIAKPAKTAPAAEEAVVVTPGDAEIERGTGLVVLAKFGRTVPSEAVLVVQPQNQTQQRIPLTKNLDDPVFGGGLPAVDANLVYRVEYAGQSTRDYTVRVYEHPRLERADAKLHYPEFANLPDKTIADTRRVSAAEGSKLDMTFQLNKPVKSAKLVAKDGSTIPLNVEDGQPATRLSDFPITVSQTYELKLEDAEGRTNKVPAQLFVEALPNRRPELKFVTPRGDQRVSPIEEITFRTEASDDFGISKYGLTYTIAGGEPTDVPLGAVTREQGRAEAAYVLKLEEIGAKPDELVSWFLWAEDTGPDGKPRRTETDMYFAEVRPFDEIFRPGQDGDGQQPGGGAGGQMMREANNQKQIILATWKLKRTEDAAPKSPTEQYLKDVPVVKEGQDRIMQTTSALRQRIEDPKMQALIDDAVAQMKKALGELEEAQKTPAPLPDALVAERAAYNALLKLAAHEFRITRNRSQSASASSAQQQAQLDQLEMQEESKRYETKREAESPQEQQQREQLATLNRLKELAQRQQDINERLKELQNSLQEAKTEQEKEEIRRQLKRLREDEQQLLADADELQQRMEQSQNQSQYAEERRKLDQARNEAQQAAEAMDRNAASQALANGTRAGKQFEEMRDEFRKKTSGQFNEEMREMRSEARGIAEKQQEIANELGEESAKPERRTLDGSGKSEQLAKQFEEQTGKVSKLKGDIKRVSEQAEAAEPLLARELYDTLRKESQSDTERTLQMTKTLAERGYQSQAQKFEEKAREGIDELKSGVERAAESVLGDEAEALRQAREELDKLRNQLNEEIAQNAPQLASNQPGNARQAGERSSQQSGNQQTSTPGENGQPSPQPGQQAEGQAQSSDRQNQNAQASNQRNGSARQQQQPGQREGQGGQPGEKQPQSQQNQAAQNEGQNSPESREGNQQPGQSGQRQQANSGQRGERSQQGQQGQGQQDGQAQQQAQAQPSGQQSGRQPGQQNGSQRSQNSQASSQRGGGSEGNEGGNDRDASNPNDRSPSQTLRSLADQARLRRGGVRSGSNDRGGDTGGGGEDRSGPLTGERFVDWSDRLRKVEEMLDDPGLRTEAARVRELAKGIRAEFKRHSVPPNWDMVNTKISTPLAELRNRVTEELVRRESKENLVPIDRDPVPGKYADRVRRYYEELGRSQE